MLPGEIFGNFMNTCFEEHISVNDSFWKILQDELMNGYRLFQMSYSCIQAWYTSISHEKCIFTKVAGKEPNNFQQVLKLIEIKSIFTT